MSCAGHSHDHEHADELEQSLRKHIDFARVTCLNEDTTGSAQRLLEEKIYENRFEESNVKLISQEDGDQDLLLHVPFLEAVSISTVSISGPRNESSGETSGPRRVKLFVNRDDIGFDEAQDLIPAAEIELVPGSHELYGETDATIDYPLRPAGRFQNVSSLVLYFPENYSDNDGIQTEISYCGFKGKGTNVKRKAVKAVYETIGMVEDHDVPTDALGGRNIM